MLNINEGVYAFASQDGSDTYDGRSCSVPVDRGYVTRLHDDYIEMFSLINKRKEWYKRDRVVSAKKLNTV